MEPKAKGFRLFIINHAKQGDHVEYLIRLVNMEDSNVFIEFLERYSNLKNLHENLRRETSSLSFPRFPPKKFFGSTDEIFINQRQTELNSYFDSIFNSREFSQLPSLKKWIDDSLRKYSKDLAKITSSEKIPGTAIKQIEQVDNSNKKGKYKEIIDDCAKKLIDLNKNNDIDEEEEEEKQKTYKKLLDDTGVFNGESKISSVLFSVSQGEDKYLNELDEKEKDNVIDDIEKTLGNHLTDLNTRLGIELEKLYIVKDIIVPI